MWFPESRWIFQARFPTREWIALPPDIVAAKTPSAGLQSSAVSDQILVDVTRKRKFLTV